MKKLFGLLTIVFFITGCKGIDGESKSELRFFTADQSDIEAYINQKPLPDNPNLKTDKSLLNRDYPIEVALYNDGKWYYDLPNLDTGRGTWKFEDGKIKLFAERDIFDMYIEVVATDKDASKMVLKFSDRFGPRVLKTEKDGFSASTL